jgi:hypothetical protein
MPREVGIKLRVHRASGRLCKTIGITRGRDGKPKKKLWYFDPDDKAAALLRCAGLKRQWVELQKSGKSFWEEAEGVVKRLDPSDSAATTASAPTTITVDGVTLAGAKIEDDGSWAGTPITILANHGAFDLHIPAASAVVIATSGH